MATRRTSGRFGDEKGVQRNKESDTFPGAKSNRSPGQSNANRALPSLNEDVVDSQRRDNQRIERGLMPTAEGGGGRKAQQDAGGRAVTRTGSRAGLLALAFEAGAAVGREIDENGIPLTGGVGKGIGKKIVDKSGLGDAVEKAVKKRDKVELSESSKERLNHMDTERVMREVDKEIAEEKRVKKDMNKGGMVGKYAKGGMIKNQGIGASMKPHNMFGKKK
jgi:hypothetical protein